MPSDDSPSSLFSMATPFYEQHIIKGSHQERIGQAIDEAATQVLNAQREIRRIQLGNLHYLIENLVKNCSLCDRYASAQSDDSKTCHRCPLTIDRCLEYRQHIRMISKRISDTENLLKDHELEDKVNAAKADLENVGVAPRITERRSLLRRPFLPGVKEAVRRAGESGPEKAHGTAGGQETWMVG